MAPIDTHSFRKLKLDVPQNHPKSVVSPLSSDKQEDSSGHNPVQDWRRAALSPPYQIASAPPAPLGAPPSVLGTTFLETIPQSRTLTPVQHKSDGAGGGAKGVSEGVGQTERVRGISISFDPHVTLDNGNRQVLDEPLSKAQSLEEPDGEGIPHHPEERDDGYFSCRYRGVSESSKEAYDSVTGEPIPRRHEWQRQALQAGQARHPLLQSTVDDLAHDAEMGDFEKIASLTSSTTATSPLTDQLRTPAEPISNYLLSPVEGSEKDFSSRSWQPSTQRSSSTRSLRSERRWTDGRSAGSLRRMSRRSSAARSAQSSASPASAFLSQWVRDDSAPAPQPDDEGQEIGEDSEYIIGRQIGFGGFSIVKEVYTLEGGKKVVRAVKIVRKQVTNKTDQENERLQTEFEHEVSIWRYLKHRYVLPLIAVYDSPFATFCITKLNETGTLFDLLRKNRKEGKTSAPPFVRRYVYQLGSALRYLHEDVRVVHRDVKLENCLLDLTSPNAEAEGGNILLCDFGMADFITNEHRSSPSPEQYDSADEHRQKQKRNIGPAESSTIIGGSLPYAAPEIIQALEPMYSTAADIWAYGVVLYALITGNLPFNHTFEPRVLTMIAKGEWDQDALLNSPTVKDAGNAVVDLVKGCLDMDSERRWSIADVLESSWLDGCKELYGDLDEPWS